MADHVIDMRAAGDTVEETASALRFSEPSAVHRALRRQTGSPPARDRRGEAPTRRMTMSVRRPACYA